MRIFARLYTRFLQKKYLLKHPLYTLFRGIFFLLKDGRIPIHFYSDEEIGLLLQKGKSIIRLGDGDIINIQLGMENAYHRDDETLRKTFRTIIENYSDESPYILSVPKFIALSNKELSSLGGDKLNWGVRMKAMYFLQFNKRCRYMDAHNFYYDNYFCSVVAPVLEGKKIICLTNKHVIDDMRRNSSLPWCDVVYVESPEVNAMDAYARITGELDTILQHRNSKDVIILSAMGPVGKCIIFEYAKRGYQGIDVGKGLEVIYKNESLEDMYPILKISKTL